MSQSLEIQIADALKEVYEDMCGAPFEGSLSSETVLLDTGLDSLGFAVLVTVLGENLGFDPFTLSPEPYYPQTFGEFVALYEKMMPR